MTEGIRKAISLNGVAKHIYPTLVTRLIRKRYTLSDEMAILRQRDSKPEEFAKYNAYVEECKATAKAELGIGG